MPITERSRPRKTPLQARSRATFDAVLTAAAHILETQGLQGFNTNAVADRAGVSIGSLYQYFPSKDAILAALIERRALAFAEQLETLTNASTGATLADDLGLLLSQAVDWHGQSSNLNGILEAEERRLVDYLDLTPAYARFHANLISLLQRHETGEIDLERSAKDVSRIIKSVMESEAERERPDWPVAIARTVGAVVGYLDAVRATASSRLTRAGRPA
jgi:AcrR family transcriptional regulator